MRLQQYINEESFSNHDILQLKKLFKHFFYDIADTKINIKSYITSQEYDKELKIALKGKFVKISTTIPKGVFGYDKKEMKEAGEVFVYPTKKGLQLMIAMQDKNDLPKDKKIKVT